MTYSFDYDPDPDPDFDFDLDLDLDLDYPNKMVSVQEIACQTHQAPEIT
jgi:hypothetical protein